MQEIRQIELNRIVREANKQGREGKRIIAVTFIPPTSAAQETGNYIFHYSNDNSATSGD